MLLIDVGAAYGDCAIWACAEFGPRVSIFSYEPAQEASSALAKTLALNPSAECVIHNRMVALGAEYAEMQLLNVPDGFVSAAFLPTESAPLSHIVGSKASVAVETLDREAKQFHWQDIDVLKVHTNGMDAAVLLGGRNLLRRTRCVVVRGTVHDMNSTYTDRQSIISLLRVFHVFF